MEGEAGAVGRRAAGAAGAGREYPLLRGGASPKGEASSYASPACVLSSSSGSSEYVGAGAEE